MAEEQREKTENKPETKREGEKTDNTGAEKKKEQTPLQKFLQKSDVLLMLYPKNERGYYSDSIKERDEIIVYKLLRDQKNTKESLLILLDTSGGNVYSAVKIMDILRTKYKKITIAVPQEAKSSGTMMCCGADKLILCSMSELGPLDKPMIHPDDETAQISALDIIKSIDGMLDTAEEREKEFAKELADEFGVPIKQCLELSSDSISKLISPMLCREDVKIYNQANRLLVIAERYADEFLNKYMLKYIKKEKLRERVALMIIRRLVWLYPDHSFAIRRNELSDLFFTIEAAEDVDCWDELWNKFEQNIGSNRKIIEFLNNA